MRCVLVGSMHDEAAFRSWIPVVYDSQFAIAVQQTQEQERQLAGQSAAPSASAAPQLQFPWHAAALGASTGQPSSAAMPVYAAALPTSSVLKFSDLLNAPESFSGNPLLQAIQPPASTVGTHILWLSEME